MSTAPGGRNLHREEPMSADQNLADDRNALPEDGATPAVQTLAHLALAAAGIAHRLCRPGEEEARDAVSGLEADINETLRGMKGVQLSDDMIEAALDEVNERLNGAGETETDDLFNALGVAVAAIGLASDGELVKQNTYGLRAIMGRLAGHLDGIVGREIDARGLDRSGTYAEFSDALEPFRREDGGDEPRANRGTKTGAGGHPIIKALDGLDTISKELRATTRTADGMESEDPAAAGLALQLHDLRERVEGVYEIVEGVRQEGDTS